MGAPKGNKFAVKSIVKSKPFGVRLSKKAMDILEKIRSEKKLSPSEVFEKLLLEKYSYK